MPGGPSAANPIMTTFGRPERQRRWTVLIRIVLVIPQIVVLFFVSIAVFFVVVYGWFAVLFLGRFPEPAASFVVRFLRWELRVSAYTYLMTDRYPPFNGDDDPSYPVRMAAAPGPLNRLAALFRVVLALPVWVLSSLLAEGLAAFGIVTWVLTLAMGRIPEPIFEASAVVLRFTARVDAYFFLVTAEWPWGSFGDRAAPGEVAGFGAPAPAPAYAPPGQYPPGQYPAYPPPYSPQPYAAPPPYGAPYPYGAPVPPPYGPQPYTAPPPYGPPATPGSPPAMPLPLPVSHPHEATVYQEAAGWRLVPTSGTRALLVVFLIIGAFIQFTDVTSVNATRATPSVPSSVSAPASATITGRTPTPTPAAADEPGGPAPSSVPRLGETL
ncbi:MAG: DUF4389 domain-containing protein [Acidimicrobiales bacterium]